MPAAIVPGGPGYHLADMALDEGGFGCGSGGGWGGRKQRSGGCRIHGALSGAIGRAAVA